MCVCVCVCLGVQKVSFVQGSKMKRELWLLNVCATGRESGWFTLLHIGTSDGLDVRVAGLPCCIEVPVTDWT